MKIIVIASRKGGSTKTTLSAHLAVEIGLSGDGPVATIDADPMKGLSRWFDVREADTPPCVDPDTLKERGITTILRRLREGGTAVVIIDTPPSASYDVQSLIAAADLVLVPVIPSPNDLRAIGETIDLIDEINRPALFVVSNAGAGTKLTNQALAALSRHGTLAAVGDEPVIIRTRTDYRSSMIGGRTAREMKATSKSAQEISDLWTAIKAKLVKEEKRGSKRTAVA